VLYHAKAEMHTVVNNTGACPLVSFCSRADVNIIIYVWITAISVAEFPSKQLCFSGGKIREYHSKLPRIKFLLAELYRVFLQSLRERSQRIYLNNTIILCISDLKFTSIKLPDRFPAPPDFLRSGGFGTVSTQPLEYNWGATIAAPI
jgi:hypothetical protein